MKCPKCTAEFETLTIKGVEVDRCTGCNGLWFDMLEQEDLKNIESAEKIDIGDRIVGRVQDKNRRIECPRCNSEMIGMIDQDQFHIHFERCPSCHGTYFDAGEFRDFKNHTVMERFKQMVGTVLTNIK